MTCNTCNDEYDNIAETDNLHIDHDPTDDFNSFAIVRNGDSSRHWVNEFDNSADGAQALADELRALADELATSPVASLPRSAHNGPWLEFIDSDGDSMYVPQGDAISAQTGVDSAFGDDRAKASDVHIIDVGTGKARLRDGGSAWAYDRARLVPAEDLPTVTDER